MADVWMREGDPAMRILWSMILAAGLVTAAAAQTDVFKIGGEVTAPQVKLKVEPEYTKEARDAGVEGTVLMKTVVNEEGVPTQIEVLKWNPRREGAEDLGLGGKAVEALTKWRFAPGEKQGKPVKVHANVEMNFRLLDRPPR